MQIATESQYLLLVNLEINREYPVINKNTLLQSQSQKSILSAVTQGKSDEPKQKLQ
ncbi:hypothetical protein [Pseudoalteromonas nigrifaciens]|uniref:hypothetical protein n=1 Tax=Pseudoalteromonas nigrifaciens TaxID=28109 RepID=UPI003F9DB63C